MGIDLCSQTFVRGGRDVVLGSSVGPSFGPRTSVVNLELREVSPSLTVVQNTKSRVQVVTLLSVSSSEWVRRSTVRWTSLLADKEGQVARYSHRTSKDS